MAYPDSGRVNADGEVCGTWRMFESRMKDMTAVREDPWWRAISTLKSPMRMTKAFGGKSIADVLKDLLECVAYLNIFVVAWREVDVTCEHGALGGVQLDPEDVRAVGLRREGGGAGPGLRDRPRQPLDARVVVRLEEGVLRQPLRGGVEVELEVLEGHETYLFVFDECGEVDFASVYSSAVKTGNA